MKRLAGRKVTTQKNQHSIVWICKERNISFPNIKPNLFPSGKKQLNPAVYALLLLTAGVSFLMLLTPLTPTVTLKALFLLPPVVMTALITLFHPTEGLTLWSLGLVLLVTQTGFQANIAGLRLSALELAIPFLLLMVLVQRRSLLLNEQKELQIPGQRYLLLFTLFASGMFVIGLLGGADINDAAAQFKGFLLYPLMVFIFLAGVNNLRILRWLVIIPVLWYIYTAGSGIWLFIQASNGGQTLSRIGDQYGTINGYAITLTTVSLLLLGHSLYARQVSYRIGGFLLSLLLFAGAIVAVARTAWVAMAGALLFLTAIGKIQKRYLLLLAGILLVTFFLLPEVITERLWQLSDSSTSTRLFYLESGWHAWRVRWLTGWGWGQAFWYYHPGPGLVPTYSWPNYHNDYLNLAVQTGLIGLLLYLGYWVKVLQASLIWLKKKVQSPLAGYVAGSQAALVGLLIAALTEHVLWRSDVAGLVGLFSGILLVSLRLGSHSTEKVIE